MRSVAALPNLLTLANAFCGLLAISKGIDALALSIQTPAEFYDKLGTACWLVLLGMVFDALDGKVARITGGASEFGAQLDSFSDALTFGCAPAMLAKVLLEREGPIHDLPGSPRLHFIAAAAFALMAILRLARFNLETDTSEKAHRQFKGLPSPAAAGAVVTFILMWVEWHDTIPAWFLPALPLALPALGLLMVSRVHYVHLMALMARRKSFYSFVGLVFAAFGFFAEPVPMLFAAFTGFVLLGVVRHVIKGRRHKRPNIAAGSEKGARAKERIG